MTVLVRAEGDLGVAEPLVAVRSLDDHPRRHLLGFVAPPEWTALGVVVEGWATGGLLAEIDHLLSPGVARKVRAALRSWDLLPAHRGFRAGDAA
jgi:hypothetical protein